MREAKDIQSLLEFTPTNHLIQFVNAHIKVSGDDDLSSPSTQLSPKKVAILVCNTQHPYAFKRQRQVESEGRHSIRFGKLIKIIETVKKNADAVTSSQNQNITSATNVLNPNPAIYTFTEVHPSMLNLIKNCFHSNNYHIFEQVYQTTPNGTTASLVTVLKKSMVSDVTPFHTKLCDGRVQSLLCTLEGSTTPFVLHLSHLPHEGDDINKAEMRIVNSIFLNKSFTFYPQILTGDLNLPLEEQLKVPNNIATSIVPAHIRQREDKCFNKKPPCDWDRAIGTLTLPALTSDKNSPHAKLTFYEAIEKIGVEFHDAIDPRRGTISPLPSSYSREAQKSDKSRLLSRFGYRYYWFLHSFLENHKISNNTKLKELLTQQPHDVQIYKSSNQLRTQQNFVFHLSMTMWNKLKIFFDLTPPERHYLLMPNRTSDFLYSDENHLAKEEDHKHFFFVKNSNKWVLHTRKSFGFLWIAINKPKDTLFLTELHKEYTNETEIIDTAKKARLEKIVISLDALTPQIEIIEHSDSVYLICDEASDQMHGDAIVDALALLSNDKFKNIPALSDAIKKHASCRVINRNDVFYIQFSFEKQGQLIAQYLKHRFSENGEIVDGDQFRLPVTDIPKDMADYINFLIEAASSIKHFNSYCYGFITLAFKPALKVGDGSFRLEFYDKPIAALIFLEFDKISSLKVNKYITDKKPYLTLNMSYKLFFKKMRGEFCWDTLSQILQKSIQNIVETLPYEIRSDVLEENTIYSEKALPPTLIQRLELTQKKVSRRYSSYNQDPLFLAILRERGTFDDATLKRIEGPPPKVIGYYFYYTLAPKAHYTDIIHFFYMSAKNLMLSIYGELEDYTGKDNAYCTLKKILLEMPSDLPIAIKTIAIQKHCSQKITPPEGDSIPWHFWSSSKKDRHTKLLYKSLYIANFSTNLEFNFHAKYRIQTLQQLVNTQEKRELYELCVKERERDGGEPYYKFRKNAALLLLENYLIFSHPAYTANGVWEDIKRKPVEYHGTGKNYPRESGGGDLTLEKIVEPVKAVWNALLSLVTFTQPAATSDDKKEILSA